MIPEDGIRIPRAIECKRCMTGPECASQRRFRRRRHGGRPSLQLPFRNNPIQLVRSSPASYVRRVLHHITILIVLLLARAAVADVAFVSPEGRFSVRLPNKPEASVVPFQTPRGEKIQVYAFEAALPGGIAIISYADNSGDPRLPATKQLQAGIADELDRQHGTIVGKVTSCDANKILCRELMYRGKDSVSGDDYTKFQRDYLAGARMYQVAVVSTGKPGVRPAAIRAVLDSFAIKD
jgi:hypothetical protein